MPDSEEILKPDGRRQALEWLLVLDAMGLPHRLQRDDAGWSIAVPADALPEARRQLALYGHENRGWPPPERRAPPLVQRSGWSAVWVAGMLVALFAWFGAYNADVPVLRNAACDAGAVLEGEWWRVVTAVGLHADIAHLGANAFFILAFGWPAARTFGGGVAWCGALMAAAAANIVSVLAYGPPRVSLGASTAVFALLGLLAGRRLALALGVPGAGRRNPVALAPIRGRFILSRHVLPPAGAVVALFVMIGVAPVSDVMGHFLGLLGGLLLGMTAHALALEKLPELAQRLLEIAGVAFFFWCWRLALSAA